MFAYGDVDPDRFEDEVLRLEWLRLIDRLAGKIEVDESSGCWMWQGALHHGRAVGGHYGSIGFQGSSLLAHRAVWLATVGPIPDGLHLDHLCRTPPCVNPDHLEPVTPAENFRRGEHKSVMFGRGVCHRGHDLDDQGVRVRPDGTRECNACCRLREGYKGNVPNVDKTHCVNGHEFTAENTIRRTSGGRMCRQCGRDATARYLKRKKAKVT